MTPIGSAYSEGCDRRAQRRSEGPDGGLDHRVPVRLGGVLEAQRGRRGRAAGLRPLVGLPSCSAMRWSCRTRSSDRTSTAHPAEVETAVVRWRCDTSAKSRSLVTYFAPVPALNRLRLGRAFGSVVRPGALENLAQRRGDPPNPRTEVGDDEAIRIQRGDGTNLGAELRWLADEAARLAERSMNHVERRRFRTALRSPDPFRVAYALDPARRVLYVCRSHRSRAPRRTRSRSAASRGSTRAGPGDSGSDGPPAQGDGDPGPSPGYAAIEGVAA